jgi:hypothetical protein
VIGPDGNCVCVCAGVCSLFVLRLLLLQLLLALRLLRRGRVAFPLWLLGDGAFLNENHDPLAVIAADGCRRVLLLQPTRYASPRTATLELLRHARRLSKIDSESP